MRIASLRGRLLAVLLATILAFWGTALAILCLQITREQTGKVDGGLREVGSSIVLARRANFSALPPGELLRLPAGAPFDGEKVSYQVWRHGGGNLMRSPGAPAAPLRADFADGFADLEVDGVRWRVFAISDADGRIQVQVGKRRSAIEAELQFLVGVVVAGALLLFVLLVGAIWGVVRWSLAPVTEVQAAAHGRPAFDLTPLPTAKLPSEVRPLVESFNRLLAQLDRAVQHERRFIADAAHELRTPLAAVLAHAQVAQRAVNRAEKDAALAQLSAAVTRGARLSEQLLDLARLDAGEAADRRSRTSLHELVEVVVRDFEAVAQCAGQHVALEVEPCAIEANTDEIGILTRNLIDNALRYSGQGGRVAVSCRPAPRNGRRAVCLRVADDGPGVPEAERERIFDRFYRLPAGGARGAGIGLSLVARIAQSHGARIEAAGGLGGRGLGISVWFPWPDAASAAAEAPARQEARARAVAALQQRA